MDRRKTDRRRGEGGDVMVLDLEAILKTLWRRRFLAAFFILLFLIPGSLYAVFKPAYYRATASVILENQGINFENFADALPAQRLEGVDIDTQVRILTSPTLARETIMALEDSMKDGEEPKTDEAIEAQRFAALRGFLANLDVLAQGRSRVIAISYTDKDPNEAARRANAHAQAYIEYQIREKRQTIESIEKWLTEQISALRAEGQKKAQATQTFRDEAGIILGKNSEELIVQQIEDLTAQLVPVETLKLKLQANADAAIEAQTPLGLGDIVQNNVVSNLKLEASRAKQELESLKARYGASHPEYKAAERQYRQAMADLTRESGTVGKSVEVQLQTAIEQEKMIRARLEALNREADDLRQNQLALESLEAEEQANQNLLQNFLEKSEEIRSQVALERADARIGSVAEIPTAPHGMAKLVLLFLIAMLALIAGLGLTLLCELIDRGIEDEEDVKKHLNIRLLGSLPRAKNPLHDNASGRKKSLFTEELKRIYLALSARKAPQTILFSAAAEGEGKTTTILALARYIASIRGRVLVVDADTLSPSMAKTLGMKPSPGLAEAMAGVAPVDQCITGSDEGFHVLPQGDQNANPVDFLAGDRLEKLFEQLKSRYDFILIDCAAIESSTDAEVISAKADQVVMICAFASTSKERLKKAANTLRQYARDIPGAVISKRV
jgi:capsular exopolysaccharide synthesis family protein